MATIAQVVEQDHAPPPHHAMFLVIPYLRVYEVLTMSLVCTSLRDAVNNDVLPWLRIIIETPLNYRLTNETLLKITSKANGRVQKLALMNCIHITNQGLQRVIEQNPFIKEVTISKSHVFLYRMLSHLWFNLMCSFIYQHALA